MYTYRLKQNRPNSIPGPVQIARVRKLPILNIVITYYTNDDMMIQALNNHYVVPDHVKSFVFDGSGPA